MNTEKNVMQIEEEDIAFFNLLMLLPREKKFLVLGAIKGMDLQEQLNG